VSVQVIDDAVYVVFEIFQDWVEASLNAFENPIADFPAVDGVVMQRLAPNHLFGEFSLPCSFSLTIIAYSSRSSEEGLVIGAPRRGLSSEFREDREQETDVRASETRWFFSEWEGGGGQNQLCACACAPSCVSADGLEPGDCVEVSLGEAGGPPPRLRGGIALPSISILLWPPSSSV